MTFDSEPTLRVLALRQILVVDDTPANLIAAEAALAPLNRPLVMAGSGTEALARLLEQEFSLAILDVQMPEMDGFELAKLIRARPRTAHLPIVFLTAFAHDDANILRAYELGAVDFLFKPVVPEILRAKTSFLIELQQSAEDLGRERLERDFENRQRDLEAIALRRERDHEQEARDELIRADRRKDTFIAMLAHELRNPLAPIRTSLDMIRKKPDEPVPAPMLEVMDRQTTVLARLIDDLLDLSRIKVDKIELRPEVLSLRSIVDAAVVTCQALFEERNHTVDINIPMDSLLVADPVRLGQVFANLLNNAARYTPREGRISVAAAERDDRAVITIADTGIGIPVELQASIFDPFVQERVTSSGSGGLGLGLALSHRLVELHHGSITVRSAGRDTGTTFEISLPLARSSIALEPRERTVEVAIVRDVPPPSATSCRIAIIDDNDDARDMLADLLTNEGYQVTTAADGLAGIELIRTSKPDLALVDIGLPGADGIEVAQTLRDTCPDLCTRLIAVTGYGDTATRNRTRSAGFRAHLVKPVAAKTVLSCLRQQLADAECMRP